MTPDGQTRTNLTNSPQSLNQTPAVHPVTGQIFFSRAGDIWRMNPDGTGATPTIQGGGADLYPAVSPNGTQLAWAQNVGGGNYEIFTATATGANAARFTDFAGSDILPFWVSDGLLAWTRDVATGNAETLLAEWPTGANQRIVTIDDGVSYPGNEGTPGESCLDATLAIMTNRSGKTEVAIIDTGIDIDHPSLRGWMPVASAESDIASTAMRCR
jgi:hypothetical protein